MPQDDNPCRVNPAEGDENVAIAQGAGLISNIMPTVSVESVTIETADRGDELLAATEDIVANFSLIEGVRGEEALRWYDNSDYTQYLRFRAIGCFSREQSTSLDYLVQRVNEYSAGLMDVSGQPGAAEFIENLRRSSFGRQNPLSSPLTPRIGGAIENLVGIGGPFDVGTLTSDFKSANKSLMFYPPTQLAQDQFAVQNMLVYDRSISSLLVAGPPMDNGEPGLTNRQISNYSFSNIAGEEEKVYTMEKSFLAPIRIRLGASTDILSRNDDEYELTYQIGSQLSLYAFIYFDYNLFAENLEIPPRENITDTTSLSSGMGFINPGILSGIQTKYKLQTPGAPPLGPNASVELAAKDASIVQDVRRISKLTSPPVNHQLYKTTKQEILAASAENITAKEIKEGNYFSPLWLTKGPDDSTHYVFAFDLREYLADNSMFPALFKNLRSANTLFSASRYLDGQSIADVVGLKIHRRTIKSEGVVGIPGGLTYGKMIPDKSDDTLEIVADSGVSYMENISGQFDQPGVFFYEGSDFFSNRPDAGDTAKVQYGVEFVVRDPSLDFLRGAIKSLLKNIADIRNIYDRIITSPSNSFEDSGLYNPVTNTRTKLLAEITYSNTTADATIDLAIRQYATLYGIFLAGTSRLSRPEILGQMTSLKRSKNPESLLEIALILESLSISLEDTIKKILPEDGMSTGAISPQRVFSKLGSHRLLTNTLYFNEVHDVGIGKEMGYDYIFSSDAPATEGIMHISRDEMNGRVIEEFNKYFDVLSNDGAPIAPFGTSYSDSAFSYFTPKTIRSRGKEDIEQTNYKNSISNTNEFDIDRYAELFVDIVNLHDRPHKIIGGSLQDERTLEHSLSDSLTDIGCKVTPSIGISTPHYEERIFPTAAPTTDDAQSIASEGTPGISWWPQAGDTPAVGVSDDDEDEPADEAAPVKLMFAFMGELKVNNPIKRNEKYLQSTINSITSLSQRLSLTPDNLSGVLGTTLSYLPNQMKAQIILSVSGQLGDYDAGFEVVPPSVLQPESGAGSSTIKLISPLGDDPSTPISAIDPTKIYTKFLAMWMNYRQIGVVEYLSDFDKTSRGLRTGAKSLGMPMWQKLTESTYSGNYNKTLLCRVRSLSYDDLPTVAIVSDITIPDIFQLPVYNQYFILDAESAQTILRSSRIDLPEDTPDDVPQERREREEPKEREDAEPLSKLAQDEEPELVALGGIGGNENNNNGLQGGDDQMEGFFVVD